MQLKKEPLEGIRVVTAEDNMLDVTGIIEGPGTQYSGLIIEPWLTSHSFSWNSLRRRVLQSQVQLH